MKKYFIIPITLIGLFLLTSCGKDRLRLDEDGITNEELKIDNITFSDISLKFDGSITNVTATMKNNTNEIKNFVVTVILYDQNGKEVKSFKQVVDHLEVEKTRELQTGILGDYSYIKDIKFKVKY